MMGYYALSASLNATRSAHNSWRDDRDRALWKGLCEAIEAVVSNPEWSAIDPQFSWQED